MAEMQVTQIRSRIGSTDRQRSTLRSLGLRRIRHTVTVPDRPEIRGMVAKVAHLVEVRYAGAEAALDIEPGQRPKGEGNPPAGPSVADDEAAEAAAELEEALAEPGTVGDLGDLVENAPSLETTDTPHKPKPRGGTVDDDEAELTSTEEILGAPDTAPDAGPGAGEEQT
jgi:large subunit ribosomal protein L30